MFDSNTEKKSSRSNELVLAFFSPSLRKLFNHIILGIKLGPNSEMKMVNLSSLFPIKKAEWFSGENLEYEHKPF